MSNLTRRERESRAYKLTVASGGLSLAAVVTFITGVVGATSMGLFVLVTLAASVSLFMLRKTLEAGRR